MELDLKELSLTLLTGAFVLLSCEALLFYMFGLRLTGFFADDWGWHRRPDHKPEEIPTHVLVVLVFCFPLGLLTEDVCYRKDDTVAFPIYRSFGLPLVPFVEELQKEHGKVNRYTLQTAALVKGLNAVNRCPDGYNEPAVMNAWTSDIEITGLAYELASRGAFRAVDGARGAAIEQWMRDSARGAGRFYSPFDGSMLPPPPGAGVMNLPHRCQRSLRLPATDAPARFQYVPRLTREDVHDSILRLWYNAKNEVYRHHEYYEEIERMQSRLDFSRTVAVTSVIALACSLLLFPIAGGVALANRKQVRVVLPRHWRRDSLVRTVIFLAIFISATIAYTRESLEINKRVFGYYSSLRVQPETTPAPHAPTP